MRLRDRFFTPATAAAIMSWRIALGLAVVVVAALAGAPVAVALAVGVAVYVASVAIAMPRRRSMPPMDPFTLGEPWRRYVQGTQRATTRLHDAVAATRAGPLRDRLHSIADRIDHGLVESWYVAKRGDEIDDAIRRLDPTTLRSRLEDFREQARTDDSSELAAAIGSIERQLESADRLQELSERTAARLRLTQTRFEELVARAEEVSVGSVDTEAYAHDVDILVDEVEGLRLAVEETRDS
jgi:hypothetical protein